MIHNVVLEKLDANMEEATIGAWRVAEGELIAVGAALVELITDKVTFDWECAVAGTVRRLVAAPGSVVPVGYVICQIGDPAEELPEVESENRRLLEEHKRRQAVAIETGGAAERRTVEAPASRVRATPAARRLAKQHGIELADVAPAEAGGIVGEADVQAYLDAR